MTTKSLTASTVRIVGSVVNGGMSTVNIETASCIIGSTTSTAVVTSMSTVLTSTMSILSIPNLNQ